TDQHRLGDPGRPVPGQVARHLAGAHRESAEHRASQIQMLDQRVQVAGEGVVVAVERVAVDEYHGLPAAVILVVDLDIGAVLDSDGKLRHVSSFAAALPVHLAPARTSRSISNLTESGWPDRDTPVRSELILLPNGPWHQSPHPEG